MAILSEYKKIANNARFIVRTMNIGHTQVVIYVLMRVMNG